VMSQNEQSCPLVGRFIAVANDRRVLRQIHMQTGCAP
jgi:hypothetical protein